MWTQIQLKGAESPSIPVTRESSADQPNTKDQNPFTVSTVKQGCKLEMRENDTQCSRSGGVHWGKASRNSEIQDWRNASFEREGLKYLCGLKPFNTR